MIERPYANLPTAGLPKAGEWVRLRYQRAGEQPDRSEWTVGKLEGDHVSHLRLAQQSGWTEWTIGKLEEDVTFEEAFGRLVLLVTLRITADQLVGTLLIPGVDQLEVLTAGEAVLHVLS